MTTETEDKKKLEPVEFELSGPHTHQGENKNKGDVITLRRGQAENLASLERGKIVTR